MGSNGLTSARHDVFDKTLSERFPESYDPGTDSKYIYTGDCGLTDRIEGVPLDAGKVGAFSDTYLRPHCQGLFEQDWRDSVHGMVHCSGGAQTKVLHFVNNVHVIKDNLFPTPVLFKKIQSASGTSWEEMYKVFNMGHRLEVYTSEEAARGIDFYRC